MRNALNDYRLAHGLTYAELGIAAGYSAGTAFKHCQGRIAISGDAAIRYSRALGIPLDLLYPTKAPTNNVDGSSLRPDRFPTAPLTPRPTPHRHDASKQS